MTFKDFVKACFEPIAWVALLLIFVVGFAIMAFLWVGPAIIAWILFASGYSWWWVVAIAQLPAWGISSIYATYLEGNLGR